ncbi:bacillithiol biosynthesis cysteine-adding enzyme BshC [Parasediminibacterium sp. JCM 36343]|uniref:bacillithiol biosynthesis cysteine-adding enzyme BshC n=1 Tax=Parasediminibacterium sp. JCM 36343 TaxID=3374279 RepID=UPI00397CFA52
MGNNSEALNVSYASTGFLSKLVSEYITGNEQLKPFYQHPVSMEGVLDSIEARKAYPTNRVLLVDELTKQYHGIALTGKQQHNLRALLSKHTFTITTAHQPNIFTGPLYFIYKIIHVIKLAANLKIKLPDYDFVPVYYMGSEDADLDELGYINLNGEKLVWQTNQTGAVGRMKVDKALLQMITKIAGEIGIYPYGEELTENFARCYTIGKTIQQATLELVNSLFAEYGLLIVIPDNTALKASFNPFIEKEIVEQFSHQAVGETIQELRKHYKPQAGGRELNLFYLIGHERERIEIVKPDASHLRETGLRYTVPSLQLDWNLEEIMAEAKAHPERFSANVILRGLFQETILPNIAFIGGGGELAYWLELKKVFALANVPYPMLILRNSFLLVKQNHEEKINKLGFAIGDLFSNEMELVNKLVRSHSEHQLSIDAEKAIIEKAYQQLKNAASAIDGTLSVHVDAMQKRAWKQLLELEKKMLRAEKRKFTEQQQAISNLKRALFPNDNLQERVENFAVYYSLQGKRWLGTIYDYSNTFEQTFCILKQ